jgi:hypothetical protein
VECLRNTLEALNIPYNEQTIHDGEMAVFVCQKEAFITKCRPLLERKIPVQYSVKSLPWTSVEHLGATLMEHVYDMTTESGTYICEGFVVHNCAFCESGRNGVIWDRFVRYEPLELVEAQLREIAELGYTGAMFYDDILPLNKPRTEALLGIIPRYVRAWRCFIRTDVITKQGGRDYLRRMADAGLVEVLAGVESGDNRIKDNIHKGTSIEQDTQVLAWCKELGIKFKASIILGLPGEDRESLKRTRDWILSNRPDRVDVNTLIPFPGTPIGDGAGEYDVFWTETWPEEVFYKGPRDRSAAIVGTSHLTPPEIKAFHTNLMKEIEDANIPY